MQIKDEYGRRLNACKDTANRLGRDNTYTLVFEECLERDTGELYGICITDSKKNPKNINNSCVLLIKTRQKWSHRELIEINGSYDHKNMVHTAFIVSQRPN